MKIAGNILSIEFQAGLCQAREGLFTVFRRLARFVEMVLTGHRRYLARTRPLLRLCPRLAGTPIALSLFLVCGGGMLAGGRTQAQILDWRNASNTNSFWHVGNNWVPAGPPAVAETARFSSSNTYEVWWDAVTGNQNIGALQGLDGEVTFLNQTSNGLELTIGGANSFADVDISGSRTVFSINGLQLRSDGGAQFTNGATVILDGVHPAGTDLIVNGNVGLDVSGSFQVNDGATVFVRYDAYLGRLTGSSGVVDLSGAASDWKAANLFLGGSGDGTFNLHDGNVDIAGTTQLGARGTLNLNGGHLRTGTFDNTAQGTLNFDGGMLTVDGGTFDPGTQDFLINGAQNPQLVLTNTASGMLAGSLSLGRGQQGTLRIENGATLDTNLGWVGESAGSLGDVTVAGIGSQWNATGSIHLGYSGDGHVSIENGGQVSSFHGLIGNQAGATGLATVTGDRSLWDCSGDVYVGRFGDLGTLNVLYGGKVSNVDGYLAGEAGSQGDVLVSGSSPSGIHSSWENSGQLVVGRRGDATLTIENGGLVSNTDGYIAKEIGSSGLVTVQASGQWTNSGGLYIGEQGTGILDISGLGVVQADLALIGNHGTGELFVSGTGPLYGGLLNVNGALGVGVNGDGAMTVLAGGVVNNQDAYVGFATGSAGNVDILAEGTWQSMNLFVGGSTTSAGGSGTLTVEDGGLVTVSDTTRIWETGTVNLNGGRFEFGQMSLPEFSRINAVGGALAGRLNHSVDTDVGSLTSLQNSQTDLSEVALVNTGTLYGRGAVDASLTNLATGQVEVTIGDRIRFGGLSNTNLGEVNNFGGIVRFDQDMTNQAGGFVGGRGQFIADGGWTNEGVMAFSGATDVLGDLVNQAGGSIVTSGGAVATFYDDVVHNGSEIRTALNSHSVFFGDVSGAGPFTGTGTVYFEGDLRPGNSPAVVHFEGDLVLGAYAETFLEFAGFGFGEFDQLLVDGDLSLDGLLTVDLLDGFQLGANQQFLVADVGGQLSGQFAGLSEGSLVANLSGRNLYISYLAGDGNDVALFTAVPEPSTGLVVFLAMIGLGSMRVRRTGRRKIRAGTLPSHRP